MNKSILTMAVASALAVPTMVFAKDEAKSTGMPSVYGLAHVSYGTLEEKVNGTTTVDNWQFRSHASRVGVKGKRDFGNGLVGIYKFEWEVNLDGDSTESPTVFDETVSGVDVNGDGVVGTFEIEHDGTSGFARRNMYVGLQGDFGQLRFGRHDTPLKMSQGKFDQFGDTDADLKNAGDEDGENRLDNVLLYMGKFGGVGVAVAVAPGEDNGTGNVDNGPADTVSASISYTGGPVYIAVAQDSYANAGNAAKDSLTRVVGTFKLSGMQIGLLYQTGVEAPDSAAAEEDWLGASFNAKVGKSGKIKAQYIQVEDSNNPKLESTLAAVGYDHKFDKKTTGYVMYSKLDEEAAGVKTLEKSFLGVGMKLKF